MSTVKLIICTVVSFVFLFVLDYVWYVVIWQSSPEDATMKMQWMVVAYLLFSVVFCYMYPKGVEGGDKTREGLRFGVLVALLAMVSQTFMWLAMPDMLVEPDSLGTALINSAFHVVELGVLGVVVAFLSGVPLDDGTREGPGGRKGSTEPQPPPPPPEDGPSS